MVTKQDVIKAARELGIVPGDVVLIHSSFKSLGEVENGADTVINGFMDAIGGEGTLVFPTLCQEDWKHVYENWHMDAKSDVGYLTNYFRKLPGAMRSDQATHSVAAMGKDAEYITQTHGQSGLRNGIFGDTPFAVDSPWEKMYEKNAKIVFLGVNMYKCTFRHYTEYVYMDKCLKKIEGTPEYEGLKKEVWCYERWDERGQWPNIDSEYVRSVLDKENKVFYTKCGNADITCISSVDFVDTATHLIEERDWNVMFMGNEMEGWLDEVERVAKSKA